MLQIAQSSVPNVLNMEHTHKKREHSFDPISIFTICTATFKVFSFFHKTLNGTFRSIFKVGVLKIVRNIRQPFLVSYCTSVPIVDLEEVNTSWAMLFSN